MHTDIRSIKPMSMSISTQTCVPLLQEGFLPYGPVREDPPVREEPHLWMDMDMCQWSGYLNVCICIYIYIYIWAMRFNMEWVSGCS